MPLLTWCRDPVGGGLFGWARTTPTAALPHQRSLFAPLTAGETTYFPCSQWLSRDKEKDGGQTERTLLGSRINPRQLQQLEGEIKRLGGQLEAARAEAAAAEHQAEQLKGQLAAEAVRQVAAGRQARAVEQENALLREQSEGLAAQLARAQAAAAAADAELARAQGELAAARQAERAVAAERARLERELQGIRTEAAGSEAAGSSLREQLAAKAAELARLRGEQVQLRQQAEDLEGEVEEGRAALRMAQREAEAAARRAAEARAELEGRVQALVAELAAAQAQLTALRREQEEAERAAGEGAGREAALQAKLRQAEAAAAAAAVAPLPAASLPPPPAPTLPPQRQLLEEAGPPAPPSPSKQARQPKYSCRVWVKDVSGSLQPDSLCLTLLGSKGTSGPQRLDITSAAGELQPEGAQVVSCSFTAPDVGRMERIRLGLVASGSPDPSGFGPSPTAGGRPCSVLLARVALFCAASGESATFWCTPEAWLSSHDDFDYEYDAAVGDKQQQVEWGRVGWGGVGGVG